VTRLIPLSMILAFSLAAVVPAQSQEGGGSKSEHRVGGGLHFWKALDALNDDLFSELEESGAAIVGSYQFVPEGLFRFEGYFEYFNKGFAGSTSAAIAPQVFVLVGKGFYGGAGVGFTYSSDIDGSISDAFYTGRFGFDVLVLPRFHLDFSLNYRVGAFDDLENVNVDTLTLGVIARFTL